MSTNPKSGNNEREAFASGPEDVFVELFAQVFGLANVQLLVHEYPVEDIYGSGRSIDYALRTSDERIAFEIDGLAGHLPSAIPVEKYEDDLLRQNSLIHQGWRVFRWTDRELLAEPEREKEQLSLFLESIPGLLSFDDFLPKQTLRCSIQVSYALAKLCVSLANSKVDAVS